MPLIELTERQWQERDKAGRVAVFFYTPLCGTCQLAITMLGIVEAAGVTLPVLQININYAPALRESWQISSVPALVLVQDGEPVGTEYAMRSVDTLYSLLKTFSS